MYRIVNGGGSKRRGDRRLLFKKGRPPVAPTFAFRRPPVAPTFTFRRPPISPTFTFRRPLIAPTLFVFLPLLAFALPNDNQKTIQITADSSQYNYKNGVSTYEGHVVIIQGTTKVTADKVTTRNNNNHKIEEAIAYGIHQQAVYTTLPKVGDPMLTAKSDMISFKPFQSTITLSGNVQVSQGENSFQGPIIIYNTKDQLVTAPHSNDGHAVISIKPT